MRTISAPMLAHLQGDVKTLATLIKVTRKDAQVFGFTDHDQPITTGGVTYVTTNSYSSSAIDMSSDLSTSNMEIDALLDGGVVTQVDLEAGKWDFAQVLISVVNFNDLTMGAVPVTSGNWGQVVLMNGVYKAEMRSLSQLMQQQAGDLYSPTCRAFFGDSKCTMNLAPLTFAGSIQSLNSAVSWNDSTLTQTGPTVAYTDSTGHTIPLSPYQITIVPPTGGSFVADGGVKDATGASWGIGTGTNQYTVSGAGVYTFNASNATQEVFINYTYAIGYFAYGKVTFTSGQSNGYTYEVKAFAPGVVSLALPPAFALNVGDTYSIIAGCDHQFSTCRDRWNNVIHFRGEPYIPGQDTILRPQTS